MPRSAEPRELAQRTHDGIEVTLLWHPHTDAVSLVVINDRENCSFVLPVAPAVALDAFHHPYAYAPDWLGPCSETPHETVIVEG